MIEFLSFQLVGIQDLYGDEPPNKRKKQSTQPKFHLQSECCHVHNPRYPFGDSLLISTIGPIINHMLLLSSIFLVCTGDSQPTDTCIYNVLVNHMPSSSLTSTYLGLWHSLLSHLVLALQPIELPVTFHAPPVAFYARVSFDLSIKGNSMALCMHRNIIRPVFLVLYMYNIYSFIVKRSTKGTQSPMMTSVIE